MNELNAYDILNRALKYKYNFKDHNPVASFEYVLNMNQLRELDEVLNDMQIRHDYRGDEIRKYLVFWFVGVEIIVNKHLPI